LYIVPDDVNSIGLIVIETVIGSLWWGKQIQMWLTSEKERLPTTAAVNSLPFVDECHWKPSTTRAVCVCSGNAGLCQWHKAPRRGWIPRQTGERSTRHSSQSPQLLSAMSGKTARCWFWSV